MSAEADRRIVSIDASGQDLYDALRNLLEMCRDRLTRKQLTEEFEYLDAAQDALDRWESGL